MKHKHAEVLIAIAEGKDVEFFCAEQWVTASIQDSITNPLTHDHFEWRIKPEPKPDFVMYAIASVDEVNRGRRNVEPDEWASLLTDMKTSDDNLKLTFDGETGKLKSAEVLK
jgi:hypothetical protein